MTNGNLNVLLYVTHANASGPFLKIWGQINTEEGRKVESKINRLRERFERGEGAISPQTVLNPGSICCAFHEDNYYRAKIITVNPNYTISVHFIDYGNSEIVVPTAIRLLDPFVDGLELITLPPIAYEFTITGIKPYTGIWNPNIVEHIKQELKYKEHQAVVSFPSRQLISLYYNGINFDDYMLSAKMALPSTIQERICEQPTQSMLQHRIHPQPLSNMSYDNSLSNHYSIRQRAPIKNFSPPKMILHENWRQPHQHSIQRLQPSQSSSQAEQSLGFINPVLEKDSTQCAIVSHIVDGPLVFSVQLQNRAQDFEELMRNINNHPLKSLSQRADIATVCLARESKHNTIRRAVVSYVGDPHAAKLFYVDYGDSETLSHSRIYDIPPQFIKPLAFSVRFSLSGLSDLIITKEMKQYFEELVKNKVLTVKIQPEEFHSPLMSFGIFYLNGKNILDLLCEAFPDATIKWPERRPLIAGSREEVTISYSEAINKFFVQLVTESSILETLAKEITEHAKVAPALKSIARGIKCLACSAIDSQWYRAEILSVSDDKVSVYYTDYGNEETITSSCLRSVRNEIITKTPPLAIQCILTGFDGVEFDPELYEKFEETVLTTQLFMVVQEVKSPALIVELYDTSKKPIINVSAMLRNMHTDDANTNTKPAQWRDDDNLAASQNLRAKRSGVKTQPLLGHQNKAKLKSVKPLREESDKWTSKSQNEPRQQSSDNLSFNNQKVSSWKNTQNDDRRFNNQDLKTGKSWMTSPQNDRFGRDNSRNERFNSRDTNSRYDRSDTNERFHIDSSSSNFNDKDHRNGRESRRGRGKGYSPNTSRFDRNNSVDKDSWSDKDSNTSRGSGKRGSRGADRGMPSNNSRGRRDTGPENDRLYKPPRSTSYNNGTPSVKSRLNDKRSNERNDDTWESTRAVPNQTDQKVNSSYPRIPPPNITAAAVKHCEIVYFISPSEFYVQLCPDNRELDNIMETITEIYVTGGTVLPESNAKIGTYCIAQYSEDSVWYRAVIQGVESTGAVVQFIDYGNTELVTFDKIKVLQEDIAKLPAQAIGCKLLGTAKTQWDTNELDQFTAVTYIKPLEAEFVVEKNNIYEVLLRRVEDGIAVNPYINEEFCDGIDLIQAKETARNKNRLIPTIVKNYTIDYAPLNQKWSEPPIYYGKKEEVIITWVTDPNNFYSQFLRNQKEFRSMMENIQKAYAGRQPTTETLEVGSSVIAIFEEDMALYRAEIVQSNEPHRISVRYVDFGNCATVQPRQIYNVEKRFIYLPKQAVNCSLKNIIPPSGTDWPDSNSQEIDKLFNIEKLECIFHETIDNQQIVTLTNNGEDLSTKMVESGIASFNVAPPCSKRPESFAGKDLINSGSIEEVDTTASCPNIQEVGVDITKLTGQSLYVKVSNVESVIKFHIQLPSAAASDKTIEDFMAKNDSKVMPKLSECEVCLGSGCLVQTCNGWKRAVVINCSQTTGIDVRFIDTGAIDVIQLDRMVALPGELSLMQEQAVECCLKDVSSSPDNDKKLKSLIENKEVIMQVDDVQNNRLVVRLFDENGRKIRVNAKESNENICPLLPMPILFGVHRVTVSHINHSGSVWVKRLDDADVGTALIDELFDYYDKSGKLFNAIPGQLCAARSADGNWYRAKIVNKTDNGVLVVYIDFGNTEEIPSDCLKKLEPQFFKPFELAIEVALTFTVSGTEQEQQQILDTHLLDKEFNASIFQINNKWMVDIMIKPGLTIRDVLSEIGVVKCNNVTTSNVDESENLTTTSQQIEVHVCHAENPSQFWIQKLNESSDLDSLQAKLQAEVINYEIIHGVPEEKSLCAALYSVDKIWYRAEVIDADEEMATLRFIDFGNTDTLLDLASGIKHLPDNMKSIEPYASKCRLDLIPFNGDWTPEACNRFASLTLDVTMTIDIIAEGYPKRIDLFLNGNSVSDILVKENHALKLQPNEEIIDEVVEDVLDPKSAFVSHINSPSEFWVQEEKSVADLELMSHRFLVADMFPKLDDIKEGQLCVAKFPDDSLWYRARIISHDNNKTNVIYIDYGNSAISTEIRAIPDDVPVIPPLSRKCCLQLPQGIEKWSDEACDKFYAISDGGATIFLLDVLEEGETSTVKLTYEGQDIVDELAKLCDKTEPTETQESILLCPEELAEKTIHTEAAIVDNLKITDEKLEKNEVVNEMNVFISQVNSPCEFYIHEEKCEDDLNIISERLADVATYPNIDKSDIKEGILCIAQFIEDSCWYRARVISHGDTGTNVFFIDYGNSAITDNIRKIPDDLTSIPPLSKKCSLVLPNGTSQWSNECCQEFFKLVDGGVAKFIMRILEESETSTVKLTLNDEDVTTHLSNLQEKYVPIIEERLPPLGEENSPNVVVSYVVSPAEFWIQAESKILDLEIMVEHLVNAATFLPINALKEGTICAAQFPEDGNWYRAKILCHNETETEVLYIDYGNSAVTNQIRALPEDLMNIAPLSKPCALKLPDGVEVWSKKACDKFIELVADGATMFEYTELYGKEPTYVTLRKNNQDVVTILSPLCEIRKQREVTKGESTTLEKSTVAIIENSINEEQVSDNNSSLKAQYESFKEDSSNTSDINIQTGLIHNSTLNNEDEKSILLKEAENSTFERITIECENENLPDTINKISESITFVETEFIKKEPIVHDIKDIGENKEIAQIDDDNKNHQELGN